MPYSIPRRRLRCIVIGAGVSGILIAIKLKEAFGDDIDFHLFEKNEDIGGTWFENRYPGCACDVPSHIYQFSFCPNPYWSKFYASSAEIRSYLKAVVFHYGVDSHISLNSKVEKAEWHEDRGVWTVSIEGKGDFECDVLFNGSGILNNINRPRIKDLEQFQGSLMHTADWDSSVDLCNKRIAIIGAAASAIQCLPAIEPQVKHVDIYIRTPSWITPPAGGNINPEHNHIYSPAEIDEFRTDMAASVRIRKEMETSFNSLFKAFIRESHEQRGIREKLTAYMQEWIPDPNMQEKLIPPFEVGCRRISPGEPYLKALQSTKVTPVFEPIEQAEKDGISAGGVSRPADVIICATGFDTSFKPRFPIIGQQGLNLQDLWKDEPTSYMGVAVAGFPNYLTFLGPNTPIANGSLMGTLEVTADFFVRLLKKAVADNVRSFGVRLSAQNDFDNHTQQMMQDMVWTGRCNSWYKTPKGKITAIWPGSSLHYRQVLDSNRWEDFEWKYAGNRFTNWAEGLSDIEKLPAGPDKDLAYYIQPHDNLPLEAYYLASQGFGTSRVPPSTFSRDQDPCFDRSTSDSESSWETNISDERVYEAAAMSV